MPISTTSTSSAGSSASRVSGTPMWLLRLPGVRRTRRPAASSTRAQQLLRRGLAVRAGDRDRPGRVKRARWPRAELAERRDRVVDDDRASRQAGVGVARETSSADRAARERIRARSRGRRASRRGSRRRARRGRACGVSVETRRRRASSGEPTTLAAAEARASSRESSSSRRHPARGERAARLLAVVEGEPLAADDLVVLVALAGDHDAVVARRRRAIARAIASRRSRDAPRAEPRESDLDVAQDRVGILGARVVAGRDREVGARARGRAPSARACCGRDRRRSRRRRSGGPRPAAARGRAPCRARRACARSRRARSAGRSPTRSTRPGTARAALEPAAIASHAMPSARPVGERGEQVLDLEVAEQRQRDLDLRVGPAHAQVRARQLDALLDACGSRRARSRAARVGEHRRDRPPRAIAAKRGVPGRRRSAPRLPAQVGPREQPRLRRAVALHVLVEVEVVLREVREDAARRSAARARDRARGCARTPPSRRRRRRRRACARASAAGRATPGVVSDGLLLEARIAHRDRAEAPGGPAGGEQDRLDHPHGAGLAVRAGDTDQRQRSAGWPKKRAATSASAARASGTRATATCAGRRRRSAPRRAARVAPASMACGQEAVAVGLRAAQRHEQRARAHRARVVGRRRRPAYRRDLRRRRRDPRRARPPSGSSRAPFRHGLLSDRARRPRRRGGRPAAASHRRRPSRSSA